MSDIDTELMRQANAQGKQAHGLMRLLIDTADDRPADQVAASLRRGKRNLVQNTAPVFNWHSIVHVPNPPLEYDQQLFDARRDALKARATALIEAQNTSDAA